MYVAQVEIYSDVSNAAVMRHPGAGSRRAGAGRHAVLASATGPTRRARKPRSGLDPDSYDELNEPQNQLWALLTHYKTVLREHNIPLSFVGNP